MSFVISHNLTAMNTNRQLKIAGKQLGAVTEQLSSGYRINRAADDASGLAISEKMRSQIRGLDRAACNVQDGISYVQVADGALQEVHLMLHRIRELSIQSANGTNTASDRLMLDDEVQELKEEIDEIFQETEFNTQKIWVGDPKVVDTVVGVASVPVLTRTTTGVSSTITNANKLAMPKSAFLLSADTDGITVSWTSYDGTNYTSANIPWEEPLSGSHSFHLKDYLDLTAHPELVGIDMVYNYQVAETAGLDDVIQAVHGDLIYNYISSPEYASSVTVDGVRFPYSISVDINYDALLVANCDFDAADTDFIRPCDGSSVNESNLTVDPMTTSTDRAFEFTFIMDKGDSTIGVVKTRPTSTYFYAHNANYTNPATGKQDNTYSAENEGLWWTWVKPYNGTPYKSSLSYSASPACSPDAIVNAFTDKISSPLKPAGESLSDINGNAYLQFSYSLRAENAFTAKDGTSMTSVGSLSIGISIPNGATAEQINTALDNLRGIDIYANNPRAYFYTYSSSKDSNNRLNIPVYQDVYEYVKEVDIQAGANEGQIIPLEYALLDLTLLGLKNTQIKTADAAQETITEIDRAIQIISEQRSLFGAYQNRLEHTHSVDQIAAENLQAAESRIRDLDVASAMVVYSKYRILQQATQAMLTQANQSKTSVLNLLQQA